MKPFLLAVLSGMALAFAHPKWDLYPLAYVALVPWLWVIPKRPFALSFLSGWVHFFVLLYWLVPVMTDFGGLPGPAAWGTLGLLAAYLALYWAATGVFAARAELLQGDLRGLFLFPAVFVAFEFLRGRLLYGFPWGFVGASQYRLLPLIQVADLGGIYAVSYVVVFVNYLLFALLRRRAGRRELGAALFVLLAVLSYGLVRLQTEWPAIGRERAALIQGNVPQTSKWKPELRRESLKRYLSLSEQALSEDPSVILWPETALPFLFPVESLSQEVLVWQKSHGVPLILGAPRLGLFGEKPRIYNSLFLIKDGRVVSFYDKQRLVPFGEFIPLEDKIPLLRTFAVASGDYSPGPAGGPLKLDEKRVFGPLICFESVFPDLAYEQVRRGATVLLVATNDAWFDRSAGPYQHFAQAVFRAVETRRYLLRVANTGISGLIDPHGRIRLATPLEETLNPCVEAYHLAYFSWYTRLGDLWAGFCVLITGFVLAEKLFRRRKDEASSRSEGQP
ncbi:MAG: apolipoprotein N-acyltransferase [Thermodesulfobacteria bacterium]|nr:apolipoprotein N-acyltransferase [Thermodesulfobacteriota bacterium]